MNTAQSEKITQTTPPASENQIHALLDEWTDAHRVKDADRITALCTDEMRQFIMAPPLQFRGADAFNKKAWFATFAGPIGYEVHELAITANDDIAFCHFLNRLSATSVAAGVKFSMWNRVTLGLRRIDGKWRVAHLHSSVPFYMDGTFKAAVDLQP
jgi:PhnB protein